MKPPTFVDLCHGNFALAGKTATAKRDWSDVRCRYANYGTTAAERELRYLLVEACAVIADLEESASKE